MWFVKDNGLTTDFIFFGVIWCYLPEENISEPNESLEREMIALEFPFLFLRVDIGDGMIWFFWYNGKVFYLLMSIDLTISCLLASVGLLFLIEIIFLALLFVLLKVLISTSSDTRIFGIICWVRFSVASLNRWGVWGVFRGVYWIVLSFVGEFSVEKTVCISERTLFGLWCERTLLFPFYFFSS